MAEHCLSWTAVVGCFGFLACKQVQGSGESNARMQQRLADLGCFAPDCKVMRHGEPTLMKDLGQNDLVDVVDPASGQVQQEEVLGFIHKELETTATFLMIATDKGLKLCLTAAHYVGIVQDAEVFFVRASSVEPGTELYAPAEDLPQIVDVVQEVKHKGIFAPLTKTGTIIVDGVGCSCYSERMLERILG